MAPSERAKHVERAAEGGCAGAAAQTERTCCYSTQVKQAWRGKSGTKAAGAWQILLLFATSAQDAHKCNRARKALNDMAPAFNICAA